jgi:hypothetical protein
VSGTQNEAHMNEASLRRSQVEVAVGAAVGLALGAGIGLLLWRHIGVSARPAELSERLAFAAKWCLIPGIFTLIGVAMVGNHRFFTDAIDPIDGGTDRTLAIWRQYLSNTLEQAVLFAIAALAFSCVAPLYWLKAIPILALLFAMGRVLFAAGYFIRPTLRAAGFALTCYPIIGIYGLTIWLFWFHK